MDTKAFPDVYFTSSFFFHKGNKSSSGTTINGRIRRASGPNLEDIVDIITGLPISDLDHGLNNIVFGDEGQLYFAQGSHTNGGVPGGLSSSKILKENFLSAAVNVAYLSHPDFNGTIAWSAPDDGNMIAKGIDVFAMGLRNPFGLLLHSNGKLYATENGPNVGYGNMKTGCGPNDMIFDVTTKDELNLLEKGNYYGSPNPKRASYFNDPRQCIWRHPSVNSTDGYTAPIMEAKSSFVGLTEFHSNHFAGQLRGNLIMFKFSGQLWRAVLTPDGTQLISSMKKEPIQLGRGSFGIDVTQAPNGNLIEMRYAQDNLFFQRPTDPATTNLVVHTCFPSRGPMAGNNTLSIYGLNFIRLSANPTVQVGGVPCPVTFSSATQIDCRLPGGVGTVDVVVTNLNATSTFQRGYRYIRGVMPMDFVLPVYSG
jgi:glucose/arabinose dehydrogenase